MGKKLTGILLYFVLPSLSVCVLIYYDCTEWLAFINWLLLDFSALILLKISERYEPPPSFVYEPRLDPLAGVLDQYPAGLKCRHRGRPALILTGRTEPPEYLIYQGGRQFWTPAASVKCRGMTYRERQEVFWLLILMWNYTAEEAAETIVKSRKWPTPLDVQYAKHVLGRGEHSYLNFP